MHITKLTLAAVLTAVASAYRIDLWKDYNYQNTQRSYVRAFNLTILQGKVKIKDICLMSSIPANWHTAYLVAFLFIPQSSSDDKFVELTLLVQRVSYIPKYRAHLLMGNEAEPIPLDSQQNHGYGKVQLVMDAVWFSAEEAQ